MINTESVVARVVEYAHNRLLAEIKILRSDILANTVSKFFDEAKTRKVAIEYAGLDYNIDLSEYEEVPEGTEVHLIRTLTNLNFDNYPVFVLKEKLSTGDWVEVSPKRKGITYDQLVEKDSYIPVEMFEKLKAAIIEYRSHDITIQDLRVHETAVLALAELQRSRHFKLKTLLLSLAYYLESPKDNVGEYKRTVLDYMRDVRNGVVAVELFQDSKRIRLSDVDPMKRKYSGVWKDKKGAVIEVIEHLHFHNDQEDKLQLNVELDEGDHVDIYTHSEFLRVLRKVEVRKAVDSAQLTLLVRLSQKFTQRLNDYHMAQSKSFSFFRFH